MGISLLTVFLFVILPWQLWATVHITDGILSSINLDEQVFFVSKGYA